MNAENALKISDVITVVEQLIKRGEDRSYARKQVVFLSALDHDASRQIEQLSLIPHITENVKGVAADLDPDIRARLNLDNNPKLLLRVASVITAMAEFHKNDETVVDRVVGLDDRLYQEQSKKYTERIALAMLQLSENKNPQENNELERFASMQARRLNEVLGLTQAAE